MPRRRRMAGRAKVCACKFDHMHHSKKRLVKETRHAEGAQSGSGREASPSCPNDDAVQQLASAGLVGVVVGMQLRHQHPAADSGVPSTGCAALSPPRGPRLSMMQPHPRGDDDAVKVLPTPVLAPCDDAVTDMQRTTSGHFDISNPLGGVKTITKTAN